MSDIIIAESKHLYRIVKLKLLRRTPGVLFDALPAGVLPRIDAIDRVIHSGGAISPGAIGGVERPWYMHPYQDDNLMVLHGVRYVDVYTPRYERPVSFTIWPDRIERDGELVCEGPAMVTWPRGVFHRIRSDEEQGSASVNFAVHYDGFDIRTNFSIYQVDTATGAYRMIRVGHLDQPGS